MSEYINRAELFNRCATAQDKGEIFAVIQEMESVDIDPEKKNEMAKMWYDEFNEFAVCSNCKEEFEAEQAEMYKYCPNCGTKMDGVK